MGATAMILIVIVAWFSVSIRKDTALTIRYDIEPIINRYPNITEIDSITWVSDSFGDTTFGNNSYWIEVYIFLDSPLDSFNTADDWNESAFSPKFLPESVDVEGVEWFHSKEFDVNNISEQMFYSTFHYAPKQNILHIYAETN